MNEVANRALTWPQSLQIHWGMIVESKGEWSEFQAKLAVQKTHMGFKH